MYLLMREFHARSGWSLRTRTTISSATVLLEEAVSEACNFTFLCLRPFSERASERERERDHHDLCFLWLNAPYIIIVCMRLDYTLLYNDSPSGLAGHTYFPRMRCGAHRLRKGRMCIFPSPRLCARAPMHAWKMWMARETRAPITVCKVVPTSLVGLYERGATENKDSPKKTKETVNKMFLLRLVSSNLPGGQDGPQETERQHLQTTETQQEY